MDGKIKIGFLGDTVFPIDINVSDEVVNILKSNDLNICNLESAALFDNDFETNEPYKIIRLFSNSDFLVKGLNLLNIKMVTLANNHFFDLGFSNAEKTLNLLKHNNIVHSGITALNRSDITNLCSINIGGKKVGVLSYGWSVIGCRRNSSHFAIYDLDEKMILEDILIARSKVDFLCVTMHWGYEFELYPQPGHRELAHKLIDVGVDIIIGHHSHMIQAIEEYKGKHIVYGLGNFHLPQIEYIGHKLSYTRESANLGMLFNLEIDKDMTYTYKCVGIKYHKDNEHKLSKETLLNSVDSEYGNYDFNQYITFYKKNKHRSGLPIFKGNKFDGIKALYVIYRQKGIEFLIRFKIRRIK